MERVGDPQFAGGGRHQLHQPHRALGGDGEAVEVRLGLDDGADQIGRQAVLTGMLPNQVVVLASTAGCGAASTSVLMTAASGGT